MNDEKARELVLAAISATDKGYISWRRNATRDGFLADVGGMTLEIRKGTQGIADIVGVPMVLDVLNAAGDIIDNVRESVGNPLAVIHRTPAFGLKTLYDSIDKVGNSVIDGLISSMKPKSSLRRL